MELYDEISDWLIKYLNKHKLETFVVGISGGIDSAVTSALCARTNKKTILITMPIHQNPKETLRGEDHIKCLKKKFSKVEALNINLTSTYDELKKTTPARFQTDLSLANTRARLRMSALYLIAASSKGIVVGTGNKVEDFGIGFFTKYGDGGVDISPIADLMKSEVYQLAEKLDISKEIVLAEPTDGLWDDGRSDEDQIGASYVDMEWAMTVDKNKPINDKEAQILKIYDKHRQNNLHKMTKIPIFKKKDKVTSI